MTIIYTVIPESAESPRINGIMESCFPTLIIVKNNNGTIERIEYDSLMMNYFHLSRNGSFPKKV